MEGYRANEKVITFAKQHVSGNKFKNHVINKDLPIYDVQWVLCRYDQKSLYNEKPTVTEIKSKYEGSKGMLCGMLEANDGSILYGSFFGVYRYDGKTVTDFKSKEGQQ